MSRERFVDPGIWTSAQVCANEPMARLLFIGMITTADDEGRGGASAVRLKASIFPMDSIDLSTIESWRDDLVRSGLVQVWKVDGQEYYALPKWKKWQRIRYVRTSSIPAMGCGPSAQSSPTSLPICTESEKTRENPGQGVEGLGGVGGGELCTSESTHFAARYLKADPRAACSPAEQAGLLDIPESLSPFPLFREQPKLVARWAELSASWANDCPGVDVQHELRQAHAFAVRKKAQGYPYRDYVRYLCSWMMRQSDKLAKQTHMPRENTRPEVNWDAATGERA